jgi:hypothetical protein
MSTGQNWAIPRARASGPKFGPVCFVRDGPRERRREQYAAAKRAGARAFSRPGEAAGSARGVGLRATCAVDACNDHQTRCRTRDGWPPRSSAPPTTTGDESRRPAVPAGSDARSATVVRDHRTRRRTRAATRAESCRAGRVRNSARGPRAGDGHDEARRRTREGPDRHVGATDNLTAATHVSCWIGTVRVLPELD